jgi:hypothetical protein
MRKNGLTALALTLAVCFAAPAAAQNLLVNPDFDSDLAGWDTSASWSDEDWQSSSSSGSATRVNDIGTISGLPLAAQCVELSDPASQYRLSAWILNPVGQTGPGYGNLYLALYDAAACDDASMIAGFDTESVQQTGVWEGVGVIVTTPPGAVSAKVGSTVQKLGAGTLQVYLDHVILEVWDPIFSDGFETGDLTGWQ